MNIRDNIVNYLFDRNYVVSLYDDFVYFFNYKYLDSFDETSVIVSIEGKQIVLTGVEFTIMKMTKDELLIKGCVSDIRVNKKDE